MYTNMRMISIDDIVPGPWDRSSSYKKSTIMAFRNSIQANGNLNPNYPLIVRLLPLQGVYQIVDGYARFIACKAENVTSVYCNVIDCENDVEATFYFVHANIQHAMSKLQIGLLGLLLDRQSGGGAGNVSLRTRLAYSFGITDAGNMSRYISAARVYNTVCEQLTPDQQHKLHKKTKQLSMLEGLPPEGVLSMVKFIADGGDSQKLEKNIRGIKQIKTTPGYDRWSNIIPLSKLSTLICRDETGVSTVIPVVNELNDACEALHDQGRDDDIESLKNWVSENAFRQEKSGRNFFNFRPIIAKVRSILNGFNNVERGQDYILNCDGIDLVRKLENESVSLFILDGPWAVNKSSISREDQTVLNDNPAYAKVFYKSIAPLIFQKMKMNTYIIIFYSPKCYAITIQPFVDEGLEIVDEMCWVKSSHTVGGASKCNPLSKKENMYLLKKGKPRWLSALSNVFEYQSISRVHRHHPTQKPQELMHDLIISTTVINDLVVDPTFGSGVTLRVAKQLGRRIAGAELSKSHFASGWNYIFSDNNSQVA